MISFLMFLYQVLRVILFKFIIIDLKKKQQQRKERFFFEDKMNDSALDHQNPQFV
jgi:hypothetical protein